MSIRECEGKLHGQRGSLTREMVIDILFGSDGDSIARGRAKTPALHRGQNPLIEARIKPVKQKRLYDIALLINRYLDDDVTLKTARQVVRHCRIGRKHRQGRPDLGPNKGSVGKRPVR